MHDNKLYKFIKIKFQSNLWLIRLLHAEKITTFINFYHRFSLLACFDNKINFCFCWSNNKSSKKNDVIYVMYHLICPISFYFIFISFSSNAFPKSNFPDVLTVLFLTDNIVMTEKKYCTSRKDGAWLDGYVCVFCFTFQKVGLHMCVRACVYVYLCVCKSLWTYVCRFQSSSIS